MAKLTHARLAVRNRNTAPLPVRVWVTSFEFHYKHPASITIEQFPDCTLLATVSLSSSSSYLHRALLKPDNGSFRIYGSASCHNWTPSWMNHGLYNYIIPQFITEMPAALKEQEVWDE